MHHARRVFFVFCWLSIFFNIIGYLFVSNYILISLLFIGPLILLGLYDIIQKQKTILRNFPVIGHFRFLLESIRPEIQQYFIETDTSGKPFSRDIRAIIYQRAKRQLDTRPFGTQLDIFNPGYEWVNHSMSPLKIEQKDLRIQIGGPDCSQPYHTSILNISAMSYGSLSGPAISALNHGAKLGNFAHNTGEGAISDHHRQGGDLIWQLGTGYFGCRNEDGSFSQELFKQYAKDKHVKMIEIKLSQGAKPGHGGILPAIKNTAEIARVRHVKQGITIDSPGYHTAFQNPLELCEFIQQLRTLSDGKPVGFKLCIGKKRQFLSLCKAMLTSGITPDFITIDGGEGGTGAAPLEFQNRIGYPSKEGLIFAHNALTGFNLRHKIKVISSGRIVTAFDIINRIAIGADLCYTARGMMFALGCIQALQCNANTCPTGITTHNPQLTVGLVVPVKAQRVANYHKNTLLGVVEMLAAMGLHSTEELKPTHLMRRSGPYEVKDYSELYEYIKKGSLLAPPYPRGWEKYLLSASEKHF